MTYKELYDKALWDLEHNNMTLGEFEEVTEPLNKEISSAEQTDGDLISRQAVIDGINVYIEKAQSTGSIDDFISFEELVVKALPSAEKTAEWKEDTTTISPYYCFCSNCYKRILLGEYKNFCPNCGTKMQEISE